MYKDFSKDEIIAILILGVSAVVYRVFYRYNIIPARAELIIFMASAGYLWFNRTVKLIIDMIKNDGKFYDAVSTIEDIQLRQLGRGAYKVYGIRYIDADDNSHTAQIHSVFSIRKWKVGDEVKIRISRDDPEKIVIVFSDAALAVITSLLGIITEVILIAVYVHFC